MWRTRLRLWLLNWTRSPSCKRFRPESQPSRPSWRKSFSSGPPLISGSTSESSRLLPGTQADLKPGCESRSCKEQDPPNSPQDMLEFIRQPISRQCRLALHNCFCRFGITLRKGGCTFGHGAPLQFPSEIHLFNCNESTLQAPFL